MYNNEELQDIALKLINMFFSEDPWILSLKKVEWADIGKRKAGHYIHKTKTIQLNRPILDHPEMEQATLDVLLHELIHVWQSNHPDFEITIEPSHGKAFRAQMYRLNGMLGRDAIAVYHNYQLPGNEGILRKAMALLARTQSENEHEAAIAAAKFTEYMQRYDLQLDNETLLLTDELPQLEDQVVAISRIADSWRKILLSGLSYIFACHLYWKSKGSFVEWHMIGREHRLDQVVFLYDYLEEAIQRLVAKEQEINRKQGISKGRAYWVSFRVGIAHNIYERLKQDFEQRMKEGINANTDYNNVSALVVQNWHHSEKQAVADFIETQEYSFRSAKSSLISNEAGFCDGKEAGNSVSINRQLKTSSTKLLQGQN